MVIAGMTAISSQIIFLREFLIVFYGNEISIGIILASWLIWGAAGSLILGYFSDRFKNKIFIFSIAQMALAFILPAVLFAIRLIPKMLGITTGEIIGYYPMMLASFIILGIPCVIMGFIFSLVCSVYEEDEGGAPKHVANVYILEASGALIGGFLVSLILIRVMIPFQILFMLSAINLLSSVFLQKIGKTFALKKMILFLSIVMLVSVLFFTAKGGPQYLQRSSLNKLWSGYNVLRSVDTVYGDLTVTSSGEQRSFYENGLHLYTVPDKLGAEESVHFGLLEAPDPKKVLLIGGGVGGLLEEILKHPVESIDYVELDPMIISLAEEVLDEQDSAYITDPRVNIINTDGRFFVKNTDNTYDCVIISLGDPYTA